VTAAFGDSGKLQVFYVCIDMWIQIYLSLALARALSLFLSLLLSLKMDGGKLQVFMYVYMYACVYIHNLRGEISPRGELTKFFYKSTSTKLTNP
jgi:hypothetical protein